MTIEIQAHSINGRAIHKHVTSADERDQSGAAVRYIVEQSAAPFVDGYSVGGFGMVRIYRADERHDCALNGALHYSWLERDFACGDSAALAEAIRRALYTLRKREPRTI